MSRFEDYIKTIAPNIHIPSYAKRFENIVEVVRCKDCRFYWKNNRDSGGVVCLATPKDDAFCSEGERREDE